MANIPDLPEIGPTLGAGLVVRDALVAMRTWISKLAPGGRDMVTVASAASLNLDSAGAVVVSVTGTVTISSLTLASGQIRILVFADGGGDLDLSGDQPTGLPITREAGDCALIIGTNGDPICVMYVRSSGLPVTMAGAVTSMTKAQGTVTTLTGSADAINISLGDIFILNRSGAVNASTLAAPASPGDNGREIWIKNGTTQANTIAVSGGLGGSGVSYDLITFTAVVAANVKLRAYDGQWYLVGSHLATVS